MTAEEVECCLAVGREALVQFAELIVNGNRKRGEIYARARIEADALISLLDEAPASAHENIHQLLDRYDTLMAGNAGELGRTRAYSVLSRPKGCPAGNLTAATRPVRRTQR